MNFLKIIIIIVFAVQVYDAWGSRNFCSQSFWNLGCLLCFVVNGKAWTQLWIHLIDRQSALSTAASKQISASKRRHARVWSTQYACFVMINPTLDSSSRRFTLYSLPSEGPGFFVRFSSFMHRSGSAVQTETWGWPGKAHFQNNYSTPWQTINELTSDNQEICVFTYGTCLLTEQLNKEKDVMIQVSYEGMMMQNWP